ncbi:MAG: mandelate racemase/muconate lactonizing enzyme family protein [Dehalococcoidia bacterium]
MSSPTSNTITAVDAIPLSIPFTHADGRTGVSGASGDWISIDLLLVRVETSMGLVGWGESFGYMLRDMPRAAITSCLAPLLIGREVKEALTHRDEIARRVHSYGRGGSIQFALSGVDIALWDLLGKQLDRPIHTLIDGHRSTFSAYASLFRYGDPDVCASTAERARAAGFRTIKLHETAVEPIAAAREACGDRIAIATDVNCAWTPQEAIARIRDLERLGLSWVEEPIWPPEDYEQLTHVRSSVTTAISSGENESNATTLRRLAESNAVDILQPSITKFGGISEFVRFLQTTDLDGKRVIPHSFYIGPGLLATLHAASLAPDDTMIEWMFANPEASVFTDPVEPRDGYLEIPDGPGLGRDPDPAVIARYRAD